MPFATAVCMASYFAARSPDTIAHRSHPFGTRLQVTDLATGRAIIGTVRDRGPFVGGRCVDLSLPYARALGITGRGVARVQVSVVSIGSGGVPRARLGRYGRLYRQPAPAPVKVPTIFDIF